MKARPRPDRDGIRAEVRAVPAHRYEAGTVTHPALRSPMCAWCGLPRFHPLHADQAEREALAEAA